MLGRGGPRRGSALRGETEYGQKNQEGQRVLLRAGLRKDASFTTEQAASDKGSSLLYDLIGKTARGTKKARFRVFCNALLCHKTATNVEGVRGLATQQEVREERGGGETFLITEKDFIQRRSETNLRKTN